MTPDGWQAYRESGAIEAQPAAGSYTVRDALEVPEMRHAVAATLLDGQPFGFTWEDVDRALAIGLDDLADRIAALLPPR